MKINEWLANPAAGPDWFELFNPGPLLVALGGNYLTDALVDKTKNNKQIAKQFAEFSAKKTINRVLLRQFVERVSKTDEQRKALFGR